MKMSCLCCLERLTVSRREIKAAGSEVLEGQVVASSLLLIRGSLVENKSLIMSAMSQDTTRMIVLNFKRTSLRKEISEAK